MTKPNVLSLMNPKDLQKMAEIHGGLPFLGGIPGSPAAAKLQRGDIVIAVNDMPTPDAEAFIRARQLREGSAKVKYIRDNVEYETELDWSSVAQP